MENMKFSAGAALKLADDKFQAIPEHLMSDLSSLNPSVDEAKASLARLANNTRERRRLEETSEQTQSSGGRTPP